MPFDLDVRDADFRRDPERPHGVRPDYPHGPP